MLSKRNLIIVGIICIILIIIGWISFAFSITKDKEEVKKEEVGFEPLTKEFVKDNELNSLTLNIMLTELMGNDYSLLINSFQEDMLSENISTMNELELENYAIKMGEAIKMGKVLEKATVVKLKREQDITIYTITLYFRDGTEKVIEVKIKKGIIITPIEDLF